MPLKRALNSVEGISIRFFSPYLSRLSQQRRKNVDEIKHKIENFQINLFNDLNLSSVGRKKRNKLMSTFSLIFNSIWPQARAEESLSSKSQSLQDSDSVVSEKLFSKGNDKRFVHFVQIVAYAKHKTFSLFLHYQLRCTVKIIVVCYFSTKTQQFGHKSEASLESILVPINLACLINLQFGDFPRIYQQCRNAVG